MGMKKATQPNTQCYELLSPILCHLQNMLISNRSCSKKATPKHFTFKNKLASTTSTVS